MFFVTDLCPVAPVTEGKDTSFLGLTVDEAAASAGQWVLLVLGIVLLLSTIFLAYKYQKSKRQNSKSLSQIELK